MADKKQKKFMWESWNAKEEELLKKIEKEERDYLNQLSSPDAMASGIEHKEDIISFSVSSIVTPFGEYAAGSTFKPSDRWECWLGYTNFPITEDEVIILNEEIEGVEALSILGAYTFCVGIAKLFTWADVRKEIEEKLCD